MGSAQVAAIKGVDGFNRAAPVVGPTYVDATEGGRRIRRGARLWTVAVATFKSESYRFLRLSAPIDDGAAWPAGYVHLPRGIDAEWVKQLVGEQLMTVKTRRGFTRLEWQKLRERNEALDCRVYARAAASISGLDRWSERKWRIWRCRSVSSRNRRWRSRPQQVVRPSTNICRPRSLDRGGAAWRRLARPAGWENGRGAGCDSDDRGWKRMSWSQAELDALRKAYASGTLTSELRWALGRVRIGSRSAASHPHHRERDGGGRGAAEAQA